jgi:hypothetical protein
VVVASLAIKVSCASITVNQRPFNEAAACLLGITETDEHLEKRDDDANSRVGFSATSSLSLSLSSKQEERDGRKFKQIRTLGFEERNHQAH